MKKITLYMSAMLLGAAAMQSCADNWETPPMDVPTWPEGFKPTMTIADLKAEYWQDNDNYGTVIGKKDGQDIWVAGTVVSSTEAGNIYKTVVLQDETGAITIGIDTTKLETIYPMGVGMAVNVTNLCIGRYNGLVQLGKLDGTGVNRITNAAFEPHTMLDLRAGQLDTTVVTIPEMNAQAATVEGKIKWQSRLVRINGVRFVEAGQPFTNGGTTSRNIIDAEGNKMVVYNSSYADFAYDDLPYGTGDVVGILSAYRSTLQLLLIDINGCIDFDGSGKPDTPVELTTPSGDGTAADPYNVAKALEVTMAGAPDTEVYVKGFISQISEIDTGSYGNATYYINDGTGTTEMYVYRGYGLGGAKFTSADQLEVGKEVIILGKLMTYNGNPQIGQGSKLIKYGDTDTPGQPAGDEGTLLDATSAEGTAGWAITNTAIWTWKEYSGAHYLNGSAYGVEPAPTDDVWAISPKIAVSAEASMSFEHAAKFQDAGLRTLCGIAVRVEGTTDWTMLTIPTWPEAGSWTWASSGAISLADYAGKTIEVAFKYGKGCTDTWEVRNLKLVNAKSE